MTNVCCHPAFSPREHAQRPVPLQPPRRGGCRDEMATLSAGAVTLPELSAMPLRRPLPVGGRFPGPWRSFGYGAFRPFRACSRSPRLRSGPDAPPAAASGPICDSPGRLSSPFAAARRSGHPCPDTARRMVHRRGRPDVIDGHDGASLPTHPYRSEDFGRATTPTFSRPFSNPPPLANGTPLVVRWGRRWSGAVLRCLKGLPWRVGR